MAGGDNGKTEMIERYTWSTIEVDSAHSPEEVALALADEARRVTSAEVVVAGPGADGKSPPWPEQPGDAWHVHHRGRWVSVLMPMGRSDHLPWNIQSGLHLSDEFQLWDWSHARSRAPKA